MKPIARLPEAIFASELPIMAKHSKLLQEAERNARAQLERLEEALGRAVERAEARRLRSDESGPPKRKPASAPRSVLPAGRRGAAAPIHDRETISDMLKEADRLGDAFSVMAYVLAHEKQIAGGSYRSKIRRLQRKFADARKRDPD